MIREQFPVSGVQIDIMKVGLISLYLIAILVALTIDAKAQKKRSPKQTVNKPQMSICTGGVLNNNAIRLPTPIYPLEAKNTKVDGTITVLVEVNEDGNVTKAKACAGHPLLRSYAEAAAMRAKFRQTRLSGIPVKVSGVLLYNFVQPK